MITNQVTIEKTKKRKNQSLQGKKIEKTQIRFFLSFFLYFSVIRELEFPLRFRLTTTCIKYKRRLLRRNPNSDYRNKKKNKNKSKKKEVPGERLEENKGKKKNPRSKIGRK